MSPLRLLGTFTAALFAVLTWYAYGRLKPEAKGQLPIDFWAFGYDAADVRAYLEALSDTGRAVYLLEMRWLDTAFPLALGAFLAAVLWRLSRGVAVWQRALACGPALAYAAVDLRENALVARLLRAGAERVDAELVSQASAMTMGKYALLIGAGALALWLWRRKRT